MPLPTFIVIGVARAATTSVHAYAAQHPDVFMSPVKETNYFSFFGRPPAFRGPGDASMVNRESIYDRDEYLALFEAAPAGIGAIGEASPRYMVTPETPERIASVIPGCRLVVGLRHPVDRAFSHWAWARMTGRETLSFEEAIDAEDERRAEGWGWGDYMGRGFYSAQLQRYLEVFPRDQIHAYLFEDFEADPIGEMQRVFEFIGVDDGFTPDVSSRPNSAGAISNPVVRSLWRGSSRIRDLIRPLLPRRWRTAAFRYVTRRTEAPRLDPDVRQRLTDRFRNDIVATAELMDLDLDSWLR